MTKDPKSDRSAAPSRGGSRRYSILLPEELAERFERVARLNHGAKSALVAEALDKRLCPEKYPLIDEALLRRLDEDASGLKIIKRDVAIVTEMLSLFVRYFLTVTPPMSEREHEPARALGKERFRVFVAQVGRRLASDHRLVTEVLESIVAHDADLLMRARDDAPLKGRPGTAEGPGADTASNSTGDAP